MSNFSFLDGEDDPFTIDASHQRHVNPQGVVLSATTAVQTFTGAEFAGVSFWAIDSNNLAAFQSGAAFSGVRLGTDNNSGFNPVNLAAGTWYIGVTTNSSYNGASIPTFTEMSVLSLPGESGVGNVPIAVGGNAGAWKAQDFTITGNVQQFWEAEATGGVFVIMNDQQFSSFQAANANGYHNGGYSYLNALGGSDGGNSNEIDGETFLPAGHYSLVWINTSGGWAGGAANISGFSANGGTSIVSGGGNGPGTPGGNTPVNLTTTLLDVNTFTGIGPSSTTTFPGGDVIFHYHINNSGSTPAAAGTVSYYISPDPTITTSDRLIVNSNLFDAVPASGSSQDYFDDIKLPNDIGPGTWYVGVIANTTHSTVESNYADNASAGFAITVTGPKLSIVPVSANKAEGSSNIAGASTPFTFEVDRNGGSATASSVNWVISLNNQPAANGADFIGPLSGSVAFAPGETAKLITVNVAADTVVEPNEVFQVDLYGVSGATINPLAASAVGVIQNDDAPSSISIVAVSANKAEGSSSVAGASTPFTFEVDRNGGTGGTSSVNWVISLNNQPAANGPDFVGPLSGAVTFAPGETAKLITVNVAADTVAEPNEVFQVDLYGASGATINPLAASAVGTIQNDDVPSSISIVAVSANKAEGSSSVAGASTPFTFEVDRNGGTGSTSSVNWVISLNNQPAANGPDFVGPLSGSVTFAPGETAKLITVNVAADTVLEPNEVFQVDLYSASGATINPLAASAVGTIQNDDSALSIVPVSANKAEGSSSVAGASTPFTFEVDRNGSTANTSSVNWVISLNNQPAANGPDFVGPLSGSLTFAPGETAKLITVNVAADTGVEPNEVFQVDLYGASGSTISSLAASALGHIQNDDTAPIVSIATLSANKAEGSSGLTPYTFHIDRSGDISGSTGVNWVMSLNNAPVANGTDFSGPLSGVVAFAPGETTKTITLNVVGDTTFESNELFQIDLYGVTNGSIDLHGASAVGHILNDDPMAGLFTETNDTVTLPGPGGVYNALGGDDTVFGTVFSDNIIGGSGNDRLLGGPGEANTLQGGIGNDTYFVEAVGDSIIELANEGTDTVQTPLSAFTLPANVENLTHTGSATFVGIGNDLNNVIIGGTGDDYLIGLDGNDTLIDGSGLNTLQGGKGDDIYAVQSNADTVFEFPNEGTDQVQTFLASYVLSPNVENLTFVGSSPHDGTGNILNNVMTGTAANDTFTGAGGNDTFNYRAPGNGFDTITDFNANNLDAAGHDHIDLTGRGLNFGQLAVTSGAGGVVIGIPGGDAIFLKNVVASQIDAGDFFF